jgi:hypothetical protein
MASDMSAKQELVLVFVAKSHVWAQRIFLVYAIDTSCVMNLGSDNSVSNQILSRKIQTNQVIKTWSCLKASCTHRIRTALG